VTDSQIILFNKIKNEICSNVQYEPTGKNAIEVTTPFIDWKGSQVSFFITENGHITDGGKVLSQLKSLRVVDDFNEWSFKEDFFYSYCIQQTNGRLEPIDDEDLPSVLRYVQGITRLPNYFEPRPIYAIADKFPSTVRRIAVETLMPFAPFESREERQAWAKNFANPRNIPLNGIEVQSDMSPKNYFRMILIISHATSSMADRKQHVEAKILHSVLWKRKEKEHQVEVYPIVERLSAYPPEARTLLKQESNDVVERSKEGFETRLKELLLAEG
jgi:hypothetical protein